MPVFEWAAIYERLEEGGGGSLGDRNQAGERSGSEEKKKQGRENEE